VDLGGGSFAEISFRSVYGAYRFLGSFVPDVWRTADTDTIYSAFDPDDPSRGLISVETGRRGDAFAQVHYGDHAWSIRDGAYNSKTVFAVVHQLVQLYSAPSNVPGNTSTVRNAAGS